MEAAKKGYAQILWLFGKEHFLTEVGTMNMFVFMRNERGTFRIAGKKRERERESERERFWLSVGPGEQELVTPPLDDGTILHGVTRDSILQLTRGWREFKVSERPITMKEFTTALKQGRVRAISTFPISPRWRRSALLVSDSAPVQLIEAFGAGTAAIVSPIKGISFRGTEYEIPLDPDNPEAGAGKLTKRLANDIMAIQVRMPSSRSCAPPDRHRSTARCPTSGRSLSIEAASPSLVLFSSLLSSSWRATRFSYFTVNENGVTVKSKRLSLDLVENDSLVDLGQVGGLDSEPMPTSFLRKASLDDATSILRFSLAESGALRRIRTENATWTVRQVHAHDENTQQKERRTKQRRGSCCADHPPAGTQSRTQHIRSHPWGERRQTRRR